MTYVTVSDPGPPTPAPYRETYIAGGSLMILAALCLLVFLLVRWCAAWRSSHPKYRVKQEGKKTSIKKIVSHSNDTFTPVFKRLLPN